MSDLYDGFAFEVTTPSASFRGGRKHRLLLVVARSLVAASEIAHRMLPSATFQSRGPEILARARELRIRDGDLGFDQEGPRRM